MKRAELIGEERIVGESWALEDRLKKTTAAGDIAVPEQMLPDSLFETESSFVEVEIGIAGNSWVDENTFVVVEVGVAVVEDAEFVI